MHSQDQIPPISSKQLTAHLPDAALQEGFLLFHHDHVLAARASLQLGGVWSVQSVVADVDPKALHHAVSPQARRAVHERDVDDPPTQHWQIIELRFSSVHPDELISVNGTCACAKGKECAHIAAAIFAVAQITDFVLDHSILLKPRDEEIPPTPPADAKLPTKARLDAEQWLAKVVPTPPPAQTQLQANEDERKDHMVYVFKIVAEEAQKRLIERVQFIPMISRPKVHGKGWTKPRSIGYEVEYQMRSMPNAQTHIDIYRLYQGLSERHSLSLSFALLRGHTGQMLLQLATQTGHLFLQNDGGIDLDQPWQQGAPRRLHWQWDSNTLSSESDPLWMLNWSVEGPPSISGEQVQILPGTPSFYFDSARHCWGLLDLGLLCAERLNKLCRMPPLPQSVLLNQAESLLRLLGGLPLPDVLGDMPSIQDTPPLVLAHVSLWPVQERAYRGLARLRLWIAYDGYRFALDSAHQSQPAAIGARPENPLERAHIHRQLAAEQTVLDGLQAQGLRHLFQNIWALDMQVGQEGLQPWIEWIQTDFAVLRQAGVALSMDSAVQDYVVSSGTIDITIQGEGFDANAAGPSDSQTIAQQWFAMSLGVDIQGKRHNILSWLPTILQQCRKTDTQTYLPDFVFIRHPDKSEGYLHLDVRALHPWMEALLELSAERGKEMSSKEHLRLSGVDTLRLGAMMQHHGQETGLWRGLKVLQDLYSTLRGQTHLPSCPPSSGLKAELRPYQQQGLDWLQFLRKWGLGGVLADDMGLGKTLQTLAHILCEKDQGRLQHPVLVVAPVSLMGNWASEATRFTPTLSVLTYHGSDRHGLAEQWTSHDIVLTSYSLLHRERSRWLAQPWHMVVLDEAQNIKNANTNAAQVVGDLQAQQRVCLSGTPMENHLGELWSLFHFLMPGFLGGQAHFVRQFRTPIEKGGDAERMAQLRARVAPFMLRRSKAAVAAELPPKIETISHVQLQGGQADLYETIRLATEQEVRQALAQHGLAKSQITLLDALLKLRQVCCDPRLVALPRARNIAQSAKLDWLRETLPDLLAEGRRILLFSQFTSMLKLIEQALKPLAIDWVKLTGSSIKRDHIIEQFTSGQVPLFLISLKAGGVGLNLTQADTVIHYDPWWNPAVEDQATDRAHRIGQTQTLLVYKLVAAGTIEERILALQHRKAELAKSVYSGAVARKEPMFTENDVKELLRPLGA